MCEWAAHVHVLKLQGHPVSNQPYFRNFPS